MPAPIPTLEHVCNLTVSAGTPAVPGETGAGVRRVIPIAGGTFAGPLLNGRVVGAGADWQTVRPDGLVELDARYLLETDDGAIIELQDRGLRHGPPEVMARLAAGEVVAADEYTMRSAIRLVTGDDRYRWLNATVFVGAGARTAGGVVISIHAVR